MGAMKELGARAQEARNHPVWELGDIAHDGDARQALRRHVMALLNSIPQPSKDDLTPKVRTADEILEAIEIFYVRRPQMLKRKAWELNLEEIK